MENSNEINLVYLIKLLYKFGNENKGKIAIYFLLPIIFMIGYHFNSEDKYTSQATFKSETVTFSLINQIYNPVLNSVNYHRVKKTVQSLGIAEEDALKLLHTSIGEIKNPTIQEKGCSFTIEITSNDSSLMKKMAQPLTAYFLKNNYVSSIQNSVKNKLESNLLGLDEQINRLNIIQKNLPSALHEQSENSIISDLGLGEIYLEMNGLYQLKNETVEDLELISEIKLVSGFSFVQKEGGIVKSALIGIIIGFFITIFFMLLKGLRVVLKDQ